MIRSMTGYGRAEVAGTRLSLTVECKSLNHRHLDIVVRLPRTFCQALGQTPGGGAAVMRPPPAWLADCASSR